MNMGYLFIGIIVLLFFMPLIMCGAKKIRACPCGGSIRSYPETRSPDGGYVFPGCHCDRCDWMPPRDFQDCSDEQLQEVFAGFLPIEAEMDIIGFFARRRMERIRLGYDR